MLSEVAGESTLELELEEGETARDLFRKLTRRWPELDRYQAICRVAVNEQYGSWERVLKPGDEVAFFPPVSGGAR